MSTTDALQKLFSPRRDATLPGPSGISPNRMSSPEPGKIPDRAGHLPGHLEIHPSSSRVRTEPDRPESGDVLVQGGGRIERPEDPNDPIGFVVPQPIELVPREGPLQVVEGDGRMQTTVPHLDL
jgi:hypothetical protein